jgi:hypothetical protein
MEISQDVIIDTILNAAGYLAAGGLSIAVFSLFGRRKPLLSSADGRRIADDENVHVRSGEHRKETRPLEYVQFDRTGKNPESVGNGTTRSSVRTPTDARRNRAEVIGLARKMIDAGATSDRVKSVLPISDAELALLSCDRN